MTMREQVALFMVVFLPAIISLFWLVDWVSEQVDDYLTRERVWKTIELRCARERHPSYPGKES